MRKLFIACFVTLLFIVVFPPLGHMQDQKPIDVNVGAPATPASQTPQTVEIKGEAAYHYRLIIASYDGDELKIKALRDHQGQLRNEMETLNTQLYAAYKMDQDSYDIMGDADHAPMFIQRKKEDKK